jgi:hypothetical protein
MRKASAIILARGAMVNLELPPEGNLERTSVRSIGF